MTASRDYTAEYLTAARTYHADTTLAVHIAAWDLLEAVANAAFDADTPVDETGLLEQARQEYLAAR